MTLVEIPAEVVNGYDPSKEELLDILTELNGVARFSALVKDDSLAVRQTLDELVLDGEVARFPMGDHILIRDLREDPEREKGWPNEDDVEAVDENGLLS